MRIAGYVRQTPGRKDPDTAFAQSERIRRWARDTGNELIAMCQDHHTSSANTDRPGFKALLDVVRSGAVDAVVIADLSALSPDKVLQEIMISDIRANDVTVIATGEDDLALLADAGTDHTRLVVRDIVARVSDYHAAFGVSDDSEPSVSPAIASTPVSGIDRETRDVVVELIVPTGSD